MNPDSFPELERIPATFEEARELIINRSWGFLSKAQKTRVRNLFETHYRRNLYPSEILFYAVNEEGEP